MSFAEMLRAVAEMYENQLVIISDSDREFVIGIQMMVEMEERIPASYIPKVEKIYAEYQSNRMR